MRFVHRATERRFRASFDAACMSTDFLYGLLVSSCSVPVMASLLSIEGGAPAAAAAAVTLAIFPLLLALQRRARAWYIRWRQWLILVLKACVTLASALMPDAYLRKSMAGAYGSACSPDPASRACAAAAAVAGPEPGWAAAVVRRASWGLPAMLVMNGLGFQSLDLAHLFSQAALTFASTFMAARSCTVYLAPALRQHLEGGGAARLLRLLPQRWAAAVRAGEPELVCRGYAMGLQILVGYVLTSAACLALEWRHRRRFAARCQWESRGADPAVFDALLLQAPGLILLHLLCKGALAVALCYTPG